MNKTELIDKAIKDLGGDISKVSLYGWEGHTHLKSVGGYYVLCHHNSTSVQDGLTFCTIEEFEQRKKERELMNKQDDWLYVGAFVVRPDGFVDEVVGVSKDNGVRLKCSFRHYCRSELKPFKSEEAKTEWYDYENQNALALPPIGEIVDVVETPDMVYGYGETKCEVVAHVRDCAVIQLSFGLGCFAKQALRPLDWDKLSKRKHLVSKALDVFAQGLSDKDGMLALYDAGYLKSPEESE